MADDIVFKCEDSMWQMMAEEGVTGIPAKPFDMRRHDMADDRIYRLSWGTHPGVGSHVQQYPPPKAGWEPEVEVITFLNKATDEVLTRKYVGMQFADWAPGWCFLLVGERVPR